MQFRTGEDVEIALAPELHPPSPPDSQETGKKRYFCDVPGCSKDYGSKGKLDHHKKKAHSQNPKKYPCTRCSKPFMDRSSMVRHLERCGKEDTEKPYSCAECGKKFDQRGTCLRHIREVHRKGAQLKCTWCKATFNQQRGLTEHCEVVHQFYEATEFLKKLKMRMRPPTEL